MIPSNLLSTLTTTLLILPQLITAQSFNDIDSCVISCNTNSACKTNTTCVCDSTNSGYLTQLVDCLHSGCDHDLVISTQLALLQKDCKNAGITVNPSGFSEAIVYASQHGGDVVVGGSGSSNSSSTAASTIETTISVTMTQTTVVTTDANQSQTTYTTEMTTISQSVSTITGSSTATGSSSSKSASATATGISGQKSAGASMFLRVWGVGAVVMVFASVGGLIFVL